MEYKYKVVHIYVDLDGNLIIFPTGRSEKWNGATLELDLPITLSKPYTDELLESKLNEAMGKCFSMPTNDDIKVSALERYLGVKGYAKAVKNRKLISFNWRQSDGYRVIPTQKVPQKGFVNVEEGIINLGDIVLCGKLAEAVKVAITKSTP